MYCVGGTRNARALAHVNGNEIHVNFTYVKVSAAILLPVVTNEINESDHVLARKQLGVHTQSDHSLPPA